MTALTTAWQSADLNPLSDETLAQLDGWFRAANYLSVGQIYLLNNPLLRTRCHATMSSPGCSAIGGRRRV
jgi:xylulose-5-phosphate/fructose-6-phosphate phosphoketolase